MFQKISRIWGLVLFLLLFCGCRCVHVQYESGRSITYIQVLNDAKIGSFEAENSMGAKIKFSDLESKIDTESITTIGGMIIKSIMIGFGLPPLP